MHRVLLVEDDAKFSELLASSLRGEGLAVDVVHSMEELDRTIENGSAFNLIILDRLIGCIDTQTRLPEIRRHFADAFIMVLSAINTPDERADLINRGVDDYLGKPFLSQELIARIKSLLRRSAAKAADHRRLGNAIFYVPRRAISVGEKVEPLPTKEFLVLNSLSESPGRVFSRTKLLELIWGNSEYAESNLVEATVTNLRKRLMSIGCSCEIKNKRNVGYWLEG